MSEDIFDRTRMLLGEKAMDRLFRSKVALFGIGGVGGYVCEALVRSGIGSFDLIDSDIVSPSNLNRQIIATTDTIGQYKTHAMKQRMKTINPRADIKTHECFYLPENADSFSFDTYDYIVDAVDTVSAKIEIITRAKSNNIPVISAMGAGNKIHAEKFRISDIYETSVCPLARVMRRELKKRNIDSLKVVCSDESPVSCTASDSEVPQGKRVPGSIAYAPAVCGLLIANEVIIDLTGQFAPTA